MEDGFTVDGHDLAESLTIYKTLRVLIPNPTRFTNERVHTQAN
jgi:hypothetical protein